MRYVEAHIFLRRSSEASILGSSFSFQHMNLLECHPRKDDIVILLSQVFTCLSSSNNLRCFLNVVVSLFTLFLKVSLSGVKIE